MAEARLAPNLPAWMVEHANRYLASGGSDGHMYKANPPGYGERTVPSLLLTTTGRKSGEKFIFPLYYGETGDGSYIIVASKGGARQHGGTPTESEHLPPGNGNIWHARARWNAIELLAPNLTAPIVRRCNHCDIR